MARANAEECPRCGAATEAGFLVDRARNTNQVLGWMPGEPDRGWFGLRLRGRIPLDVTARRCSRCGWLDLHAPGRGDAG
jgi:hypothetical protein